MKNCLISIIIFLFSYTPIFAQSNLDSIKTTIKRFSSGFENKDINLINNEVSQKFSLGMNSFPGTRNYLQPIIGDKGVNSIEFLSLDRVEDGLTLVNVLAKVNNEKEIEGIIAIDSEYKIAFADVLDKLFKVSRYDKSEFIGSIPIEVNDDMIILSIKINDSDRPLRLQFDTGANGTALTKEVAENLSDIVYESQKTQVVGGQIEMKKSSGNTFHLSDKITLKNQGFIILNNSEGSTTDGIIGLNIAHQYITEVDMDKKVMNFYSFGDYIPQENYEILDITIPQGVMLIDGSLNIVGKKDAPGQFIFDTGAGYHLIAFESYVRKNRMLLSGFKPESQGSTVSLGFSSPTFSGKAHSFTFAGKYTFNDMPVTLQASTGRKNITTMSGSIGFQLIKNFNFTIDMLKKQIYIHPDKQYK